MRRVTQQSQEFSPRGVFITATDTGVGKTLVAAALVIRLIQRGVDVGVMKPIETGVSRSTRAQSDGARLQKAAGDRGSRVETCPYIFRRPVAPLSAAEAEGTTVRMANILRSFRALSKKHPYVVVEGVGGVHVPITGGTDVLGLVQRMRLPVIVIGQSGLGGINHALLTLHALRQNNIPVLALVLNQCRPTQTQISRMQEQSTVNLLRRFAGVPVLGPIPYSPKVSRNWNEGVLSVAKTPSIIKLAKLVRAFGQGTL